MTVRWPSVNYSLDASQMSKSILSQQYENSENEGFVDTNVFVASLTNEPDRGQTATRLLNQEYDFCTSILNLMEIRSVMTKKKTVEQNRVEDVLSDIYTRVDIYAPEISDQITAYSRQQETILYTLDCVLLALADDIDATLTTFDGELLDHGAVPPDELVP
ncbi:type II toxin-antitoxin system VapC family toxin [Halovenus salina]|uniref:Ribonuclease VapC n=1 Tax=Halovenus salina TaxID=1510225 RepID=A0ABD5W396_9EURY|nr:PIN domain-containing protein [Halovenus salina]